MYVEVVKNQYGGQVTLLRKSVREGSKVVKKTLANLSEESPKTIQKLVDALKGKSQPQACEIIEFVKIENVVPWGHVEAVLTAMNRLKIAELIDSEPSPQRDIIQGLIAARILEPKSKNGTVEWWRGGALASKLNLDQFNEDAVYRAMDWLLPKKELIEQKLAIRHLEDGGKAFIDMSSSYFEGQKTPYCKVNDNRDSEEEEYDSELIRFGYSRDKKRNKPQVNYAIIANEEGIPVSIDIYPGNTSDMSVFMPAVDKIQNLFNISHITMIGDRGMISSKHITVLRSQEGIDWITALRSTSIKKLVPEGGFSFGLFDEQNLCEFTAPDEFPGERLTACRNPMLMYSRAKTRDELIEKTKRSLEKIKARVEKGTLKGKDKIGVTVGKVIAKEKMGKHFILEIEDNLFNYSLNIENIEKEKTLDGIYVIRASLPVESISAEESVRQYKNLANVERAFRTMKTVSLHVRPIFHYLDNRIRCHIFLTMLSYYVEWHLREAWREITFADSVEVEEAEMKENDPICLRKRLKEAEKEDKGTILSLDGSKEAKKAEKDPVLPHKRSKKTEIKVSTRRNTEGLEIKSFRGLLQDLSELYEVAAVLNLGPGNECSLKSQVQFTRLRKKAFDLLKKIPMWT
ncbi:MAG: IS1634 family transposase [Deltaproteobacteria bacterium]|jgi:transposase|nr:IS1634 family transposase [Deltaproteobacteria bacterium]